MDRIWRHNSEPSNTYELGINQFADLTEQEFVENYLGTRSDYQTKSISAGLDD